MLIDIEVKSVVVTEPAVARVADTKIVMHGWELGSTWSIDGI